MSKIPSMSSAKLCKLLEKGGAKRVLRQLKFTDEETSKIRPVKL